MRLHVELVVLSVFFLIQHFCLAGKIPVDSATVEKSERRTSVTRSVSTARQNLTISNGHDTTQSSERKRGESLEEISGSTDGTVTSEKLEGNDTATTSSTRNIIESSERNANEGSFVRNTTASSGGNTTIGKLEGNINIHESGEDATTQTPEGNITPGILEGESSILQDSKIADVTLTTTTESTSNSTTNSEDAIIPSSNLTTSVTPGRKSKPQPVDEGPIIIRPKETTTVEPVLVPRPCYETMTCPHCGKTRVCEKSQDCSHCPHCGRSLNDGRLKKFTRSNGEPKTPSIGSEVLPANGEKSEPQFERVQADVNLSRKEIMQRRLNFQRAQEFMRSIEPKVSIQGNTENLKSAEPIITLNGKAVEIPLQRAIPHEEPSTFTEKIKWFFGFGEDKTKPQEVRSPLEVPSSISPQPIFQNPAPTPITNGTTGILNCPFSKLQRLKQLKATVGL
ncbi:unnamed protein product [Allacma fusca]|uniref:Uncharacterized protein n=1 Tax=Allacma fusca TaxID=39272 RepID=A0A8J2L073_9HEXA|nr:unnamed protein product [Allacma fusca]